MPNWPLAVPVSNVPVDIQTTSAELLLTLKKEEKCDYSQASFEHLF